MLISYWYELQQLSLAGAAKAAAYFDGELFTSGCFFCSLMMIRDLAINPTVMLPGDPGNFIAPPFANLKGKQVLIFSPHLDDAVLSMGSLLSYFVNAGKEITVVTVFTEPSDLETDRTRRFAHQGGCETANAYFQRRRDEDRAVLATLGVSEVIHLGFVDGAWRTSDGPLIFPDAEMSEGFRVHEQKVLPTIIETIKSSVPFDSDTLVFCPIAWGNHIDHVLTRNACTAVFGNAIYFADFPYLQKFDRCDQFIEQKQLVPKVWSGDFYTEKARAIKGYHSQAYTLFVNGPMKLDLETFYFSADALARLLQSS